MFFRKQKEIDRLNTRCVEIDELEDTLKRINNLMTCNQYDNNQAIKNKIIELTSDYQSIC